MVPISISTSTQHKKGITSKNKDLYPQGCLCKTPLTIVGSMHMMYSPVNINAPAACPMMSPYIHPSFLQLEFAGVLGSELERADIANAYAIVIKTTNRVVFAFIFTS